MNGVCCSVVKQIRGETAKCSSPLYILFLSNFSNFTEQLRLLSLFLVVGVDGIVDGVVETTALFALYRHASDEITHVDHVAKLA